MKKALITCLLLIEIVMGIASAQDIDLELTIIKPTNLEVFK